MTRALVLLAAISFVTPAAATAETVGTYRARQVHATPASVLDWLKRGNRRVLSGQSDHGGFPTDSRARIHASASGQRPLAAVLACIDSRTTPELAFDVAAGDLFTARVGANVINDDVLGSLEISAASGIKVIVVLGHTDCGGVKGACNGLELGHATGMLAKVKPAIAATNAKLDADPVFAKFIGERVATNPRFVAEVSHENARHSVAEILERSPLLREMAEKKEILILPALYHVESGEVTFDE